MSPEQFMDIVAARIAYKERSSTPTTMREELAQAYEIHWYDWNVVTSYIAHAEAKLELIAEAWRHAPDVVERQPRWPELASHPDWPAAVAAPPRTFPLAGANKNWSDLPAFYTRQLFEQKDTRTISRVLGAYNLDGEFYNRWSGELLGLKNQSIDLRLIALKQIDWQVKRGLLEGFAKSKYANVRLAVARHVHTGPDTLRLLCTDADEKVAKAAVSHRLFPSNAQGLVSEHEEQKQSAKLDKLSTLGWKELGDFLNDPDFPAEGLALLAARGDDAIQFACAMHPNASEAIWRHSLNQADNWKKAAVALNPALPETLLRELGAIDDADIAFALAGNPALPLDMQLGLARHPDRLVRLHLADHTFAPAVWAVIAAQAGPQDQHTTLEQLLATAIDPKSTSSKIGNLQAPTNRSRSKGEALASCIGHAIACHPKLPEKLLGKLQNFLPALLEANPSMRLRLLEGHALPEAESVPEWKLNVQEILKFPGYVANSLLRSKDLTLQRMASTHVGVDRALLYPLWLVPDTLLQKKIAQRLDLPRFMYEMLWQHGGDPVRAVLKANKSAIERNASFTQPLAASSRKVQAAAPGALSIKGNKKERTELARTSKDEATLLALATDKLGEVRAALISQESLPWSVIVALSRDSEPDIRKYLGSFLSAFPAAQTVDIETALCAEGGDVADHLATWVRDENLQFKLLENHRSHLVYNDFLTPKLADYFLENGSIEELFRVAVNLENRPAFAVKAADFLLRILDQHRSDPLAGLAALHPAADEEQRKRHKARVAAFIKSEGKDLQNRYYEIEHLMEAYRDEAGMQALALQCLAPDVPDHPIRRFAAGMCSIMTAPVIASLLGGDVEERAALAANPGLPDTALDQLKTDPEIDVRAALAASSRKLDGYFIDDEAPRVRAAMAQHTRATALQRQLLAEKSEDVLAALAENAHCDTDVLAELVSKNSSFNVRRHAAENPKASTASLKLMLKDRNGHVRAIAARALAQREPAVD